MSEPRDGAQEEDEAEGDQAQQAPQGRAPGGAGAPPRPRRARRRDRARRRGRDACSQSARAKLDRSKLIRRCWPRASRRTRNGGQELGFDSSCGSARRAARPLQARARSPRPPPPPRECTAAACAHWPGSAVAACVESSGAGDALNFLISAQAAAAARRTATAPRRAARLPVGKARTASLRLRRAIGAFRSRARGAATAAGSRRRASRADSALRCLAGPPPRARARLPLCGNQISGAPGRPRTRRRRRDRVGLDGVKV